MDPKIRAKRRALLQRRREEMYRQFRIEFDDCFDSACDLLPNRANEEHFRRVIHALWWPLRGDVPEEWWDAEELEQHYQRYLDENGWWLGPLNTHSELPEAAIEQLATVLTSTSLKIKAMRPVESAQ